MTMTTRNRLLVSLGLILFVSFVTISFINYKVSRAAVHTEILRSDLPLTMDNIYSELTSEMIRPLLVASSMATDTFVHDWALEGEEDAEKIIQYLEQIQRRFGFFTSFFVSAKTGIYYRYNGIHKRVTEEDAHDVWYYEFIDSKKEYHFDVDTDEGADNILTIFINYRVEDRDGNLLGVTGVGLKMGAVAGKVREYRQKYGRDVYLADGLGIVQIHPETSLIEKANIYEMEGLGSFFKKIQGEEEIIFDHQFLRSGEEILLTVRNMRPLGWYLFVEQNETKALTTARNNLYRTLGIGFLSSLAIIAIVLFTTNRYQDRIETYAIRDELTGIANRRGLEPEIKRKEYNYSRRGAPFSVVLLDLDGFKRVNDQLGHMVGDSFLREIVQLIATMVRASDVFARWGGDEFVILTESEQHEAVKVADRIRQAVEKKIFAADRAGTDPRNQVTISCGISSYCEGDSFDTLLRRADTAMYQCKKQGGNQVEFAL